MKRFINSRFLLRLGMFHILVTAAIVAFFMGFGVDIDMVKGREILIGTLILDAVFSFMYLRK